jgi:ubiquinone/menaquinone biosynthesis C-methylase UbiE
MTAAGSPGESAWGGSAGEHRVTHADLFDDETRPHNERLRAACGIRPGDRVLDIGCGTGQSTRDAARAAAPGRVLGVDVSEPMLEMARRRSAGEGLDTVSYEHADAQVHPFPPGAFDIAMSQFGAMFFTDPVAAFTNIGRALAPGGRLVLLVWQARDLNEWATAVRAALAAGRTLTDEPVAALDPFSLADPATVEAILQAAGFASVGFIDVHEPVRYGQDGAQAYELVLGLRSPRDLLAGLDAAAAEQALCRLRETLAAHQSDSGVFFDSRAWIITATRR